MIEDKEIRELFKAECEEHLQGLEEGLLSLEASPEDSATLQAVFRAAHSLKGAARMLGINRLELVAHECEELLGAVRRGQAVFSTEMADRLSPALDAMRGLVQEAVTGEEAGVDVERVLAQLAGEGKPPGPAAVDAPVDTPPAEARVVEEEAVPPQPPPEDGQAAQREATAADGSPLAPPHHTQSRGPAPGFASPPGIRWSGSESASAEPASRELPDHHDPSPSFAGYPGYPGGAPASHPEPAAPAVLPPAAPPAVRDGDAEKGAALPASLPAATIDTVRVASQRLDALMVLAGELVVTTSRLRRGLAAFAEIAASWEAWEGQLAAAPAARARHTAHGTRRMAPGSADGFPDGPRAALAPLRQATGDDVSRLVAVADELEESIRKMRLLPLATLFNLFPRLVRDLARALHKEVRLVIEGGDTTADKRILEEMKDPLMHMLRNAIDHGLEPPEEREARGKPREGSLTLRARQTAASVIIELQDDGRGLDEDAIRRTALKRQLLREDELQGLTEEEVRALIFAPGFSTSLIVTDLSGRGVGMDVVRANVERLKGTIRVDSRPGEGCRFQLQFPVTLATTRVLLARVGAWTYALPVEFVEGTLLVEPEEVFTLEGRDTISVQGRPVSAARLVDLLELPHPAPGSQFPAPSRTTATPITDSGLLPSPRAASRRLPCILLSVGPHRIGLFVDALLDEQEVVLKPLGGLLRRVRTVSGATILGTGEVCMVLDCHDLLKALRGRQHVRALQAPAETVEPPRVILLVEDSITTRVQEKRILEGAGYEVVTAVDGADALTKLVARSFDAVVSDIEMPNMDGLTLTERIRQDPKYREIPIILVTTLSSEEDRRRGIEAGANAYITKGTFEQQVLLDTLGRLV